MSTGALDVPALSLVVLIGATGSGKSTFARAHFAPSEVLSSDACRAMVSDDENDQSATGDAFDVLNFIAGKRLERGRLTVVDATNVQPEARRQLVALAREHDVLPVAIVLDLPEQVCRERNAARADRQFGPHVLRRQRDQLRRGVKGLSREGFRHIHVLRSEAEVAAVSITRTKLYSDLRDQSGPFDIVGDIHGCRAELEALLVELGYVLGGTSRAAASAPGIPRAAGSSSSATWSTAALTSRACCDSRWAWCPAATRSASRATTRTSCCARCAAARCRSPMASRNRWSS